MRYQPDVHLQSCHRADLLTSKSLDPACMYLSMKSRMVSQSAAKVGRDSRGDRCWRKTCTHGQQHHSSVTVAAQQYAGSAEVGTCWNCSSSYVCNCVTWHKHEHSLLQEMVTRSAGLIMALMCCIRHSETLIV